MEFVSNIFSRSSARSNAQDNLEGNVNPSNQSHGMIGEVHSHLEESIRPYIDLIDTLRTFGVHKDLSLPTIVVIGDQSSGKSSVLEALSGVALPRGSGIVTRCPLELRLKKVTGGVNWKAVISYRKKRIVFVASRPSLSYDERNIEFEDPSLVEKHVKTAQNEVAGNGVGISDELITLEVMSPDVCDLTLIDLPGIARVPVQGQPHDIGNQIKRLIMKFIANQEAINMVVVPCNTDIATTEALNMAQEVDPDGRRTVAVLTKPDLIDRGTENNILAIVRNTVIPLRKGYIMVKCRGQQEINDRVPLREATETEHSFFHNHDIFRPLLEENNATIKCLAIRLTHDLVDHIKKSLPQLDQQIKRQLHEVKNEIRDCEAGPPQDPRGAKQFLIKTLTKFNDQIKNLSTGEMVIKKNLFVQLRVEFKKWYDGLDETRTTFNNLNEFSQEYRGRELLGFSNYRVFEMNLQDRVGKLKDLATNTLYSVKDIILKQFIDVSNQCFRKYPALLNITMNKIDNIQSIQQAKTEQRISDQFEMEMMIYTQDPIFLKFMNETSEERYSEQQLPVFNIRSSYSEMLQAYYEIVVQRMADQLPMLISFYMLKETAELLSNDMLTLLEGVDVSELLFEDSEVSKRRKHLESRLFRLNAAQDTLAQFV